jgi:pimeloyl-ACP methyl ester carboxylesterase
MGEHFVEVEGWLLAATDTGGDGSPLVFVHGNSSSRAGWARQLQGPLARDHRLVALDLPGHGASSWLGQDVAERYTLAGYAGILAGALRALGLEGAVLVGHSLGGHLILEALARGILDRPRGVALHGAPPLASAADFPSAFLPEPLAPWLFTDAIPEPEARALCAALYGPHSDAPPDALRDLRATDPAARACLGASIAPADEAGVVRAGEVPVALLRGADDAFVSGAWLDGFAGPSLWRGAVQTIPGAGHYAHWERPEAYAELLGAFAAEVTDAPR